MDSDELRGLWNRGQQHTSDSPLSTLWGVLNPYGPTRLFVDRLIFSASSRFHEQVKEIIEQHLKTDPSNSNLKSLKLELKQLLETSIDKKALSSQARHFLETIDEMELGPLQTLCDRLVHQSSKTDLMTDFNSKFNSVSMSPVNGEGATSVAKAKVVAVANAHDIRINISFHNGQLKMRQEPNRGPLNVRAEGGVVAVATSDRIYISIDSDNLVPTALFENAVRKIGAP
jgi:hypothetical protein